ncbi:M14 family zinc carboxypeptidase [Ferrimonas balearica]|uniref:M14 family zinc carboxypeptidase n=1 Tax=Ferrimonas balearica TaxID=44012 RepID=UPI001C9A0437|nr:M14 family zinc carboxypeptidase [Ferrimonas balearica]MBY5923543.1 peptidase M14 [Ferrimonas balearica]MBY5997908.1 peptidase M14 [Ferrimonas balearica]
MKKLIAIGALFFALALPSQAADPLATLAPDTPYLDTLPTPSQHFRGDIGERHLRYDEVSAYFHKLADNSARMTLENIGFSHQGRPQWAAIITSEANHQRLDEILAQRARVAQGERVNGPVVIWLAYSIHGDEASGLHASPLFAYHLAAGQSAEVKRWLEEAIIIITPSQNPDGNDRFSNWVNGYRGAVPSGHNYHREHFQGWPSGRVNHYWADLNRDWLYQAHPESRGRVAFFQRWQPHVVSDYHEMGHQSSYFFQPGVPDRTHPLTPKENQTLTARIADHHARALDALYQPYFSRESFDDFYYGKGSTYPDINGSVGILFEQATARGLHRDSERGEVTLALGVRNHLATSFSTVRGALAEAGTLARYQQQFFQDALEAGRDRRGAGYLVSARGDRNRLNAFATILASHRVRYAYLQDAVESNDQMFAPGDLFIPFAQPQYRLLEALFDERTEFADNTFYDVSAFSAELAFDLNRAEVRRAPPTQEQAPQLAAIQYEQPALQWLIPWGDRLAPAALNRLLEAGYRVRFAESGGRVHGRQGAIDYDAGALTILGNQPDLASALKGIEQEFGVQAYPVVAGQAIEGADLGSRRFHAVKAVKPAILVGRDVSQYEAGMLWYYLDQILGIETVLLDGEYFNRAPLSEFTHLFLVDGAYSKMRGAKAVIDPFVRDGGTVVAWKRGVAKLAQWEMVSVGVNQRSFFAPEFAHAGDQIAFAQRDQDDARRTIGGAIVSWKLDTTHPLAFGLSEALPMMKNRELSLVPKADVGRTVARYDESLLLSGYMAPEYQKALSEEVAAHVQSAGSGQYVLLADNPLFRNFWLGGEKLVANSLFLVPALN